MSIILPLGLHCNLVLEGSSKTHMSKAWLPTFQGVSGSRTSSRWGPAEEVTSLGAYPGSFLVPFIISSMALCVCPMSLQTCWGERMGVASDVPRRQQSHSKLSDPLALTVFPPNSFEVIPGL